MIFDEESKNEEEVNFESEESTDTDVFKAKLKKLKDELETVKKERLEYLDGWQRCKADAINARKEILASSTRAGNRGRDQLLEDLISALDSFDMAMQSDAWQNVDKNWRAGMENVHSQLISALQNQNVALFAKAGEAFDPKLHEAVQEIESEGTPGTIAKVLRKGYKFISRGDTEERLIRPAQVSIVADK